MSLPASQSKSTIGTWARRLALSAALCLALLALIPGHWLSYLFPTQSAGLHIREARWLDADTIALQLEFRPSPVVVEALEANIALKFELLLRGAEGQSGQSISLTYAPLLERFELIGGEQVQRFRLRTELLDAFSSLKVPAKAPIDQVRLRLSLADLPAPLRLPAAIDSNWWLDSAWIAVEPAGNDGAAAP